MHVIAAKAICLRWQWKMILSPPKTDQEECRCFGSRINGYELSVGIRWNR